MAISDFQNFGFSKKYFEKCKNFGKFWINFEIFKIFKISKTENLPESLKYVYDRKEKFELLSNNIEKVKKYVMNSIWNLK